MNVFLICAGIVRIGALEFACRRTPRYEREGKQYCRTCDPQSERLRRPLLTSLGIDQELVRLDLVLSAAENHYLATCTERGDSSAPKEIPTKLGNGNPLRLTAVVPEYSATYRQDGSPLQFTFYGRWVRD